MIPLPSLWAPVLVSAVAVFVVSSIVHMALKYHQSDYKPLAKEAETLDVLRPQALPPGTYFFPHCPSHKDLEKPEVQEKFRRGPVGMITMLPSGRPQLAKNLSQWFAFTILISIFAGYVASRTLAPGAAYMAVFRLVSTAAFMAYGVGQISDSIWKGQLWSITAKNVLDGFLYSLATGGVFGWLWPR